MNTLTLKIIALITMIIDHYGAVFQEGVKIYRIIGRIAFPIYCFLLVEGYLHTKDIKKYGKRLLLFALISEIPFDLAFYNKLEFRHQNIFFTLFIGLIAIYLIDNREGKYNFNKSIIFLGASILATLLHVDYSIIGIIYILAFYFTKDYPKVERLSKAALVIFLTNLIFGVMSQHFALMAIPILYFYNKEYGPKNRFLQMLFYIAYPLHLLVFYILNAL